ncbi:IS110 family transposase, partial [Segatella bryantii]
MTYIGIDVSKDTLVVAYSPEKNSKTRTFKNTTRGIHEFIRTISKDEHHCVMEATGNYSALLVYLLSEAGITTSLENPLKVKNFARAMLSTVKTDEIDARLIALYGEKMNPA